MSFDPAQIDRIYDQLNRIEETLDRIRPELSIIKTDLNYHIHRTDLLEQKFSELDKDVTKLRGFFTVAGWLVGVMATILTILDRLGAL